MHDSLLWRVQESVKSCFVKSSYIQINSRVKGWPEYVLAFEHYNKLKPKLRRQLNQPVINVWRVNQWNRKMRQRFRQVTITNYSHINMHYKKKNCLWQQHCTFLSMNKKSWECLHRGSQGWVVSLQANSWPGCQVPVRPKEPKQRKADEQAKRHRLSSLVQHLLTLCKSHFSPFDKASIKIFPWAGTTWTAFT